MCEGALLVYDLLLNFLSLFVSVLKKGTKILRGTKKGI